MSVSNRSFICKICGKKKPIDDSISIKEKICVTCFSAIQIYKRNRRKIHFYRRYLKSKDKLTETRSRKIRVIEKLNAIASFILRDILEHPYNDIDEGLKETLKNGTIPMITLKKGKYTIKSITINPDEIDRMIKILGQYKDKILKINTHKYRFGYFIDFIGKKSGFSTLKNRLNKALGMYIRYESGETFNELKEFIIKGIEKIAEPDVLPNIAYFLYENYERIFLTLMTVIFPYSRERISFDSPIVSSRTDFGLKLYYRYNSEEIRIIDTAIKKYGVNTTEPKISKILFINTAKTISIIFDEVFKRYYKKLKIPSPVSTIINISGARQHNTKKYDEVIYWIRMREW